MSDTSSAPINIGIVHPGQMGVSIGAALVQAGHVVHWASEHRSASTLRRANEAGLQDVVTLGALCRKCAVVFSVCPPDQAKTVAGLLSEEGFSGVYVDCNAVSPATSHEVGASFSTGTDYVDAGIIGPPANSANTTRLYLSGSKAADIAVLFDKTVVEAKVIGTDAGAASALKMAYAGWTKGSAALLLTQFALAKQQNVEMALLDEWGLSLPELANTLQNAAFANAPKAWRFVGEMNEIADSLEQANLPREWFDGAAASYNRMVQFKNRTDADLDGVIAALLSPPN